ncbi:hypothetical protein ACHAWF_005631 [Thalassiosira exigua]
MSTPSKTEAEERTTTPPPPPAPAEEQAEESAAEEGAATALKEEDEEGDAAPVEAAAAAAADNDGGAALSADGDDEVEEGEGGDNAENEDEVEADDDGGHGGIATSTDEVPFDVAAAVRAAASAPSDWRDPGAEAEGEPREVEISNLPPERPGRPPPPHMRDRPPLPMLPPAPPVAPPPARPWTAAEALRQALQLPAPLDPSRLPPDADGALNVAHHIARERALLETLKLARAELDDAQTAERRADKKLRAAREAYRRCARVLAKPPPLTPAGARGANGEVEIGDANADANVARAVRRAREKRRAFRRTRPGERPSKRTRKRKAQAAKAAARAAVPEQVDPENPFLSAPPPPSPEPDSESESESEPEPEPEPPGEAEEAVYAPRVGARGPRVQLEVPGTVVHPTNEIFLPEPVAGSEMDGASPLVGGMPAEVILSHKDAFYLRLTKGAADSSNIDEWTPPAASANLKSRGQLAEWIHIAAHWDTGADGLDPGAFRAKHKTWYSRMKPVTANLGRRTGIHLRRVDAMTGRGGGERGPKHEGEEGEATVLCRYDKSGTKSVVYLDVGRLFDALFQIHSLELGHRGRDATKNLADERYANVPDGVVRAFLETCPVCGARKGNVVPGVGATGPANPLLAGYGPVLI